MIATILAVIAAAFFGVASTLAGQGIMRDRRDEARQQLARARAVIAGQDVTIRELSARINHPTARRLRAVPTDKERA
jgi:hypothetical protein